MARSKGADQYPALRMITGSSALCFFSNLIMPQGEQLAISRTINPLITPSQSKHAPNQS
jgi:hypothetical protein